MSVAFQDRASLSAGEAARSRTCDVLIATVNRAAGDTGVHTHTRSLLAGLGNSGLAARVVTPFDGSRMWLPVFAVRPLLLKHVHPTWSTLWYRRWHLTALRQTLRAAVRASRPRHVLTQCPLSARAALDVRAELGAEAQFTISTVCHFNRSEADEYRDKGELPDAHRYEQLLAFEAAALSAVDHVVYVSRWARDLVEHDRSIRTRASSIIWNGLADHPPSALQQLSRTDLQLDGNDLVLINVGTLEPRKNQLGLLELFAQLVKRHPAARLLLVGDGPHRAAVEAAIERLGLRDHVQLLGHRRDVGALMKLADLYVHYATAENCPMVLIEAARAGLPLAALPVGGIPEILETVGDSVALVANDHQTSLDRLDPLLSSRTRRDTAGEHSRHAFHSHFGGEAMVRQYLDVIRGSTGSPAEERA